MKRALCVCCHFILALLLLAPRASAAPETIPGSLVGVCSAIVYDLDNDIILFEQNADQRIPPASLTKIMSMFLALDFIKDGHATLDSKVRISRNAAYAGGSSMGLKPGETVPLRKLLLGMAVSSGNDASFAVAEYVGGSAWNFVKMMNARADFLGMDKSHFANPHGLPNDGQYTTARDMLALARAYLRSHPEALEFHDKLLLEHGGYRSWNKNPLLGQYPGCDGLKTGWIRASGYNLITTAQRDGKRLLVVILGAPDLGSRGMEACRLLDAGFMVCDNTAVSVAAALDAIPVDETRIDPLKTGREAGLLKKRRRGQVAQKVGKFGRSQFAPPKKGRALQRNQPAIKAAKSSRTTPAKRKTHAASSTKRQSRG